MREILFRGKIVEINKWVEGGYCAVPAPPQCFENPKDPTHVIICENPNTMADWNMPRQMCMIDVIPETVGQYTSLTDKNGNKIFEGDIIKVYDIWCGGSYKVVWWEDAGFKLTKNDRTYLCIDTALEKGCEVIGNIHDNAELLEEAK